ncbi:cytochrome c-type biogenesis protein CcmF [Halopseudomonas litoralis]|uniref:Cytochrome c-type biogenesis protein CcmF n=1 Tax=Halopseudomonas litoralis TaxID=797277 RepID=A0A1H1LUH8_9GAMM|nr:cytochrome c biogenesis protein CcsA [Halopseudomonas litoralis]SDR77982.1 cytochrome c-type biogenesis protein CcmF [Halopseudomonas litoralis]
MKSCQRVMPLLVTAGFCLMIFLAPSAGNALLAGVAVLLVWGTLVPGWRVIAWRAATGALVGSCLALMLLLATDSFGVRYVWLYSSEALPTYLKLANLWGGDEGTILLLALLIMPAAMRHVDYPGFEGSSSGLIAAWYVASAAWFGPFTATPEEWLAAQSSQGMNAHLQSIWMVLHAPLILAAYAWTLAPVGAAIQALRAVPSGYANKALVYGRRAWWLLTAGIGFGMIWALQDFTFGQLWHWDPVQTSIFIVWALLGAILHGVRRWRDTGTFGRVLPVLSLLLAASTCMAMAVTRSEVLASSHRYIGTTSWLNHLSLALLFLCCALCFSWRRRQNSQEQKSKRLDWTLRLSVLSFSAMAMLAAVALMQAHLRQWLQIEKTDEQKPFFETLSRWADSNEIARFEQAFAQWDMDGYALARWLLPPLLVMGLVGGYTFLRRALFPTLAGFGTVFAVAICLFLAWQGGWLTEHYTGRGVLSQHIVRVLPWFDAALAAALFLLLACLLWCVISVWRSRRLGTLRFTGSLALIHGGAVVALVGGLAATALNSYLPILLQDGEALGQWRYMTEDMQVRVLPASSHSDYSGFRAVAQVEIRHDHEVVQGQALFQDARQLPPGYQGPVRQLCEILDYRYARHAGDPGYMLHPFIIRSWLADTQVWVPASAGLMSASDVVSTTDETLVVVRRYPLVSLVWGGFIAMLLGALLLPRRRLEKTI